MTPISGPIEKDNEFVCDPYLWSLDIAIEIDNELMCDPFLWSLDTAIEIDNEIDNE